MRFGHLFYPVSFDDSQDSQIIDDILNEAVLVEELGLDAIWLTEHYFSGETVYADPLVLAGALAVKTKRVLLGFAVLEMALHNPVRLATQTALLDNLSHGRLMVGTGRGSSFNAFEYAGFGTTLQMGKESLAEAEDLLVKAWTTDNLDFRGKFWKVAVPAIRPRPYQKPHPPIARACLSDESIIDMASKGRVVLFRCRSIGGLARHIELFRATMQSSGYDGPSIEGVLDQSWVWADGYIAETDEQALNEFVPAFERVSTFLVNARKRWNPAGEPVPEGGLPLPRSAYGNVPDPSANELLVGSPQRVAQQIALLKEAGTRNLMISHRGAMPREKSIASLRFFSERVMPLFR